jgi:hypothetical protein
MSKSKIGKTKKLTKAQRKAIEKERINQISEQNKKKVD